MKDPKTRLIELITQVAKDAGCNESQTEQILALFTTTIEEGVPDVTDLQNRLKSIGGATK